MRVLVAPDSFGGALSAPAAARAIATGWSSQATDDDVRLCPLSAGGPGFVETLHATLGGEVLPATVRSPLGDPVPATVLLVTDATGARTAYVESTQATGLSLVPADLRDPSRTSSAGVGELLGLARRTGARRVVVGAGEGATHDAGAGMLAALGVGAGPDGPLGGGGAALADVTAEDLEGLARLRAEWSGVDLVVACDVDLPLLGLHGASAAAAPGRGATPEQAQLLERALAHAAHTAVRALGPSAVRPDLLAGTRPTTPVARLAGAPGAGAGGGLAFGLALLGARVLPGAALVADVLGLDARLADVDLVVTGEEQLDARSLHDRVCAVVAARALAVGVPTVVIARRVDAGRRELAAAGIAAAYPVEDGWSGPRTGSGSAWGAGQGSREAGAVAGTAVGTAAGRPGTPAEALAARAARVARTWSRES